MRKHIIMIIVMTAILLCSCCDQENDEVKMREWRLISSFDMSEYERGGCFVVDTPDRLDYLDFSSVEVTPVCDDATCKHNEGDKCSAFGKTNHPFVYNDKLYYFKTTDFKENGNNTYSSGCELWQADINGRNEKKLFDYPKYQIEEYNNYLLYDNALYMILFDKPYDENFNELSSVVKLVRFDLKDNNSKEVTDLVSGYSVNASISGVWDKKIILTTTKPEINKPYMERFNEYKEKSGLSEKEAWKAFSENDKYQTTVFEIDPQDLNLTKSKLPAPQLIDYSLYVYFSGKELKAFDTEGGEISISSGDISNVKKLDKYITFDKDEKTYLYYIEKRELTELKELINIIADVDDDIIYRTEEEPKTVIIDGEEYFDGGFTPKAEYTKKPIAELTK